MFIFFSLSISSWTVYFCRVKQVLRYVHTHSLRTSYAILWQDYSRLKVWAEEEGVRRFPRDSSPFLFTLSLSDRKCVWVCVCVCACEWEWEEKDRKLASGNREDRRKTTSLCLSFFLSLSFFLVLFVFTSSFSFSSPLSLFYFLYLYFHVNFCLSLSHSISIFILSRSPYLRFTFSLLLLIYLFPSSLYLPFSPFTSIFLILCLFFSFSFLSSILSHLFNDSRIVWKRSMLQMKTI